MGLPIRAVFLDAAEYAETLRFIIEINAQKLYPLRFDEQHAVKLQIMQRQHLAFKQRLVYGQPGFHVGRSGPYDFFINAMVEKKRKKLAVDFHRPRPLRRSYPVIEKDVTLQSQAVLS